MRIKTVTILIIAVLIAVSLPMELNNIGTARGDWIWTPWGWEHPDPDSWPAFNDSTGCYCCCSHIDPYIETGGFFDSWVSVAVTAHYANTQNNTGFDSATWTTGSGSGGWNLQWGPLITELCVDYNDYALLYCYDVPQYRYIYPYWGFMVEDSYPSNPFNPNVNTVQGSAFSGFITPEDLNIFFMYAPVIPTDLIMAHDP